VGPSAAYAVHARSLTTWRHRCGWLVQVYTASVLVTVSLGAQLYVKPFENKLMNALETLGLAATFVTQMGSILYWRYDSLSTAVTAVLIIVNGGVVLLFALALVRRPHCHSCRHRCYSPIGWAVAPCVTCAGELDWNTNHKQAGQRQERHCGRTGQGAPRSLQGTQRVDDELGGGDGGA
jgi:hypothetical protein